MRECEHECRRAGARMCECVCVRQVSALCVHLCVCACMCAHVCVCVCGRGHGGPHLAHSPRPALPLWFNVSPPSAPSTQHPLCGLARCGPGTRPAPRVPGFLTALCVREPLLSLPFSELRSSSVFKMQMKRLFSLIDPSRG